MEKVFDFTLILARARYTPERIKMNIAKADVIEAIDLLDDSDSLRLLHGIIFTYILLKKKAEQSGVKLDNLQVLRDTVEFTFAIVETTDKKLTN